MDHAYKFGMMVCKQTVSYTEQAKYFAAREKVHKQQLQFLRSEVERLPSSGGKHHTINQLGLELGTSQASLTATQTDLDATKNGKKNADYPTTCENNLIT